MPRGLSFAAVSVLDAIARGYEYGFDVIDATGLPSGTVYPALSRLERDGYLRSDWEDDKAAHAEKRPPRRYYRLTASGARALASAAKRYRALGRIRAGRVAPARGRG
jgi:PadR family transcriptional regulator, regulatory protein PadR